VGKAKAKIFAFVLAAGLAAATPAHAEDAPAHAPCTSLDLWGDLKAVIDGCEAMIKSGKLEGEDLAEALRHQGDAYFRSFMVRFAFNNYQHALQLKPDWPRALWNLSNAYAVLGYGDLAVQSARRAAEVDPTYSNAHAALGVFLSDTDESLKEFDRALELDPKNYLARWNLAITYEKLGRTLDALHELDTLLQEDETAVNRTYRFQHYKPDQDFVADIMRERAVIFNNIGSPDEALAELRRAVERKPGYAYVVVFKSWLIRKHEAYAPFYTEALSSVEQALKIHPDTPELMVEKANLMAAKGDRESAMAILADTSRLEQSADAEFFVARAEAWEWLKEFDHAAFDVATAMTMDGQQYYRNIQRMQDAGYLMDWPGLDPKVAFTNALAACVRDPIC
jgi:tetratricopeptide (TPR) repeat protein